MIFYLATLVVGHLYPSLMSFRALRTPEPGDDIQWLTYAVVNSMITVVESVFPLLAWMPGYYLAKLGVLVWLVVPQTRGAQYIYQKFIEPYLSKADARISQVDLAKMRSQVDDLAKKYGPADLDKIIQMGLQQLNNMTSRK